jgi:hypothetical protein
MSTSDAALVAIAAAICLVAFWLGSDRRPRLFAGWVSLMVAGALVILALNT